MLFARCCELHPNDIVAGGIESASEILVGKKAHIGPRSVR